MRSGRCLEVNPSFLSIQFAKFIHFLGSRAWLPHDVPNPCRCEGRILQQLFSVIQRPAFQEALEIIR
jgi:hypothetical protein